MNWYSLSDHEIIRQLGRRIRKMRLRKNISQEVFAEMSGIDRATLGKFENGSPVSLLTFIQILRTMKILENLDQVIPAPEISPLQRVKLKGREPKRASKRPGSQNETGSSW